MGCDFTLTKPGPPAICGWQFTTRLLDARRRHATALGQCKASSGEPNSSLGVGIPDVSLAAAASVQRCIGLRLGMQSCLRGPPDFGPGECRTVVHHNLFTDRRGRFCTVIPKSTVALGNCRRFPKNNEAAQYPRLLLIPTSILAVDTACGLPTEGFPARSQAFIATFLPSPAQHPSRHIQLGTYSNNAFARCTDRSAVGPVA